MRGASRPEPAILGVVMLGGAAGSVVRYALTRAVHPASNGFPTATLIINLSGSFLLGALLIAVTEVWRPHHLLRPLLGTGVLGGYTTFSTFALEVRGASGSVAVAYLVASVVGGIVAASFGMSVVRRLEPRFEIAGEHEAVDAVDPDLP
ncbi:MAG TPA: CrcB family protein [Jatrophihabitantaceae bacterium]|nr:CrcB family protein [Jatrophihabitantaceae bacterium]